MRLPDQSYPVLSLLETHLPDLRPAQQHHLALWVTGTLLAGSSSQSRVLTALQPLLPDVEPNTLRQHLRDGLRDGAEKAAPCQVTLDETTGFAPLLHWITAVWQGPRLALALDATTLADRVVVLCLSVLYRGSAILVAWRVLPANQPGSWRPHLRNLFTDVAGALPPDTTVLVLTDRGLWSPQIWRAIQAQGWHPLQRLRPDVTFCPAGGRRGLARTLVPGPGHAWVGAGHAFKHSGVTRAGTLVVCWGHDAAEPWLCLIDLPPEAVGVAWYGLRIWIEQGFRALKRGGWDWQHTRRTDPGRISRHRLVLAVATLVSLLIGTREEDAEERGQDPHRIRVAVAPRKPRGRRVVSVLRRGVQRVRMLLLERRWWRQLWLWPDPWPDPPPGLQITVAHHLAPA